MTRVLGLVGAVLLTAILLGSGWGSAAPVGGPLTGRVQIGPGQKYSWREPVRFRGGHRACVIAMGNPNNKERPVSPLELVVSDEQGNRVGRDYPGEGAESPHTPGNDVCVVIWYPPRDGNYTITVTNHGSDEEVWIALK